MIGNYCIYCGRNCICQEEFIRDVYHLASEELEDDEFLPPEDPWPTKNRRNICKVVNKARSQSQSHIRKPIPVARSRLR